MYLTHATYDEYTRSIETDEARAIREANEAREGAANVAAFIASIGRRA